MTLDEIYLSGEWFYKIQMIDQSLPFYLEAAQKGHILSMHRYATILYAKWTEGEDYLIECLEWFETAGKAGHKESQYFAECIKRWISQEE